MFIPLGRKDDTVLTWGRRYNVAIRVAAALNYLHCGTAQPVIHRDVKSSNILLDDDFEPKVFCFRYLKSLYSLN